MFLILRDREVVEMSIGGAAALIRTWYTFFYCSIILLDSV